LGHAFQSLALFVQLSALVVKLSAAGGSPAVGAKAWFWAPAEGEGNVCRQVVAPARVSSVPLGAADAVNVVGTLAIVAFAVAQLISVFWITVSTLLSFVTAASAREVALGTKSVSDMSVVSFIFVGDKAMLIAEVPVMQTAGFSFLFIEFPLLTIDAQA